MFPHVHRELRGNQSMSPVLVPGCGYVVISYSTASYSASLASYSETLISYELSAINLIDLASFRELGCLAVLVLDNFNL